MWFTLRDASAVASVPGSLSSWSLNYILAYGAVAGWLATCKVAGGSVFVVVRCFLVSGIGGYRSVRKHWGFPAIQIWIKWLRLTAALEKWRITIA